MSAFSRLKLRQISIKPLAPFLMSVALLLFVGFIFSGSAKAETDLPIAASAPEPNSGTTSTGADFTPLTGVGKGAFDGQYMWYKVYVKNGQSASVSINQTCTDSFGNPSVSYTLESLSDIEQDYGSGSFGNVYPAQIITSGNCAASLTFPTISSTDGTPSSLPGHGKYRVFAVYAQMNPIPAANAEQYFNVTTDNPANTYIGMAKPDVTNQKVLRYSTVYKTSGTWSYSVMFAPRCDQPAGNQVIKIYDPDNGVYQGPPNGPAGTSYMTASLQSSPSPGAISWTTVQTWTGAQVQNGAFGTSNTTSSLGYSYDNNHIYKFHVLNSTHPNTIQIQLPYDQFDATPDVQNTCHPPPPDGQCNIVSPPIRTTPGTAVSFPVRITARPGSSDLTDPPIRLGISQPSGFPAKFDFGGTITAGNSKIITVTIQASGVPNSTGTYTNWRTYRLENNGVAFGGSCQVDLIVTNTPTMNGKLKAASCGGITGEIWLNETDNTTTWGRLHITAPGVDVETGKFQTWNTPHNVGGKWFYINPYNYVNPAPAQGNGPSIDVLLNYHTQYTIQLEVLDTAGGWDPATNPAGDPTALSLDYPCITGTIATSCTSMTGTLSYVSASTNTDTRGWIHIIQGGRSGFGTQFNAHYSYGPGNPSGNLDPFNPSNNGGTQYYPHLGTNMELWFIDPVDGSNNPVLTSDGSAQVATSIPAGTCLTFSCSTTTLTFEATTTTTADFSINYTNYTLDNIPGYVGTMTVDPNQQVRINGGTGPINSSGGIFTNGVSAYPGSLNWTGIVVSSTGAPYQGGINLAAYFGGAPINEPGSSCTRPVNVITKPYFKAFGASVSTGGAFNKLTSPIDTTCTGGNTPGGVKAFAHFKPFTTDTIANYSTVPANQKYGASVEYSIESLGTIDGTNTSGLGFYSGDTHDAAKDYINTLDLGDQTNSPTTTWGGNLGSSHCIENYYSKHTGGEIVWNGTDNVPTMFGSAAGTAIKAQAYQKDLGGPGHTINLDGGNTALPRNTRVTLFVNGDVYIHNNIIYDTATKYDPSDPTTVPPYFALIATGSIYVDPGVTELDGLYVAQSGDGFSTCGDPTTQDSNMPKAQIGANCISKLTVNGAVVAYQLKLLRIGNTSNATNTLNNAGGDNGSSLLSNPAVCATAQPPCPRNNNAVEEFNYTPSMVENQPYYLCTATCGNLGTTEKTFNLPPVY